MLLDLLVALRRGPVVVDMVVQKKVKFFFFLNTGAAVTAFVIGLGDDRLEQNHHSKGYVASGERVRDFGGARLKCTDDLTGRYNDVRKILGASHTFNKRQQCWWLDSDGSVVPQTRLDEPCESSDATIRTKDWLVFLCV